MLQRIVFLAAVGVLSVATVMSGTLAARPAEADGQIGSLQFSESVGPNSEAVNPRIEFDGDNNGVFVSFAYSGLPAGSGLSRIVRLNGEDYNWDNDTFGHLNCCSAGGSGRVSF